MYMYMYMYMYIYIDIYIYIYITYMYNVPRVSPLRDRPGVIEDELDDIARHQLQQLQQTVLLLDRGVTDLP